MFPRHVREICVSNLFALRLHIHISVSCDRCCVVCVCVVPYFTSFHVTDLCGSQCDLRMAVANVLLFFLLASNHDVVVYEHIYHFFFYSLLSLNTDTPTLFARDRLVSWYDTWKMFAHSCNHHVLSAATIEPPTTNAFLRRFSNGLPKRWYIRIPRPVNKITKTILTLPTLHNHSIFYIILYLYMQTHTHQYHTLDHHPSYIPLRTQ